MAARLGLGEVLHVIGIVVAVAIIGFGVWIAQMMAPDERTQVVIAAMVLGVLVWGIGYACRYVLAGR